MHHLIRSHMAADHECGAGYRISESPAYVPGHDESLLSSHATRDEALAALDALHLERCEGRSWNGMYWTPCNQHWGHRAHKPDGDYAAAIELAGLQGSMAATYPPPN